EGRQYEFSPLAQVQKWSDIPRGKPLFESTVVFENFPHDAGLLARSPRLRVESVELREQTNFPVTLVAEPGAELSLKAGYDGGRIEAGAIERLLGHLQTLLAGFVAGAATRLADLPLLTPAERHRVLVEWNPAETALADDRCVTGLFEAQVNQTPGA